MSAVSVRFLGHAAVALEYDGTTVLIDPFLTGNPKAAISADEVAGRRDPADPRPRRPHRRHRRDRQAHRRERRRDRRAGRRARRRPRRRPRRPRPQPRRHGHLRLGLGALGPAWHTSTTPKGTSTPRPGSSSSSATSDLPPRRHGAVQRPRAARPPRPPRRSRSSDRRPLHDGSLRRRHRRRADRRRRRSSRATSARSRRSRPTPRRSRPTCRTPAPRRSPCSSPAKRWTPMITAVVLIEADRDQYAKLGGRARRRPGCRRGLLGHRRLGLRRARPRAAPRAARRGVSGEDREAARGYAHPDDGGVRGLLEARSRGDVRVGN